MVITHLKVLERIREAEARLEFLNREIRNLESEKQTHLKEVMKGGGRCMEVERTDQALHAKRLLLSKAKEQIGNLRGQLETKLARFRKQLIEEKQKEFHQHIEKRERYLKHVKELELEASRCRYLVTGIKDHRLAGLRDSLPLDAEDPENFVPVDEAIGRTKVEISRINRMTNEALLKEYLARETTDAEQGLVSSGKS